MEEPTLKTQSLLLEWSETFIDLLPTLFEVVVVLVVTWGAGEILGSWIERLAKRYGKNSSIQSLFHIIVKLFVFILGLVVALNILGLSQAVTSVLAGVGIIGIALGFAFQDVAANFIAGVTLIFRSVFNDGDLIEVAGHVGTVENTNLRSTVLRTPQGQLTSIPNKIIFENEVVNYTALGSRRVDLTGGVGYEDDLDKAESVIKQAIREHVEGADITRPIDCYFTELGDSAIIFRAQFWVDSSIQPDFLTAQSEAIKFIKNRLDEEGISMPFPTRTVELHNKG